MSLDDRARFSSLLRHQLVTPLHRQDRLHLGPGGKGLQGSMGTLVADRGDHGLNLSKDGMGLVAKFFDLGDDLVDQLLLGSRAQGDDHSVKS